MGWVGVELHIYRTSFRQTSRSNIEGLYCVLRIKFNCNVNILAEATDPAAGAIRLFLHGGMVNKAYNRCLFTRLPGK